MPSIEGVNCLPLLACNNAVTNTSTIYCHCCTVEQRPFTQAIKAVHGRVQATEEWCIEGFKRREGKHKRGVWGSRGHVDHVILHPHVIFEPAHVLLSYQGHGKGGWITGITKIIRKFIAQMRLRQNLRKLTKFCFRQCQPVGISSVTGTENIFARQIFEVPQKMHRIPGQRGVACLNILPLAILSQCWY